MEKTLYEKALAILPPEEIDHHESDLYLKHSKKSQALIAGYEYRNQVKPFVSPLDGCVWYDVPFAYIPYWEEKCGGK